jgi:hypothetical protein
MSWHFLQGQEAASWAESSLAGAPSALLRLIPTRAECSWHGRLTDASNRSPSGMTLRRSTGTNGAASLTWFRGDSPVRTYRQQEKGPDSTGNDLDCGPKWPGSLAKCSPPMSGWKTRQCSLFGGLTEFSGTWPRWGMMRGGELLELATPVLITDVSDVSSWPTPCRIDEDFCRMTVLSSQRHGHQPHVTTELIRLHGRRFPLPSFGEALMGLPNGWTRVGGVSATDKFRQWCVSHGILSPESIKPDATTQPAPQQE